MVFGAGLYVLHRHLDPKNEHHQEVKKDDLDLKDEWPVNRTRSLSCARHRFSGLRIKDVELGVNGQMGRWRPVTTASSHHLDGLEEAVA